MDNAILELCGSCDFFASPWCGVYRNQWIIKDCFGTCTALVKNIFFTTNSSRNICKFLFLRKVNEMTFYAKPTLFKECNQKRRLRSNIYRSRVSCSTTHRQKWNLFLSNPASFKSAVLRSMIFLLFLYGNLWNLKRFSGFLSDPFERREQSTTAFSHIHTQAQKTTDKKSLKAYHWASCTSSSLPSTTAYVSCSNKA